MRATASATTSPRTKLMAVSGIVDVTVARSSGPSESRISRKVCSFTTATPSGATRASRGRLRRHVCGEVLLGQPLQRAVGLEVREGLVDGGHEVGALAGRDDLLGHVARLGRDLHALVAGGLLVVEHG